MEISLEGRRAFVSAGAAGIGRAIVLALRSVGADVVTCDVDEEALETLPDEVHSFRCDVADPDAVDEMFDEILTGGLDLLVNNAGVAGPTAPVEDITAQEWRRTLAIGIDAQFFCARRAAPVFKAQRSGVIVNMISTAGLFGYPNRTPYAAAKWAAIGLTKTLAMELGPHGVRVNGVAPGSVTGARIDRVIAGHAAAEGIEPETVRELYTRGVSMQCFIEPTEIADLVCFLASDAARHISGQIIAVDGHTETLHPRL